MPRIPASLKAPAALLALLALLATPFFPAPLPSAKPEDAGMSAERLERLTAVMQQYVDSGRLAGNVVLVARNGRVVYRQAFGQRDKEAGAVMQPDNIFRIASQTKAIVSTAVMILQEDGRLVIGDPVSKYLPEFAKPKVAVAKQGGGYDLVDAARPITIRQLLTHTSGLSYGHGPGEDLWKQAAIQDWYFADRDEPIRDTIRRIAALPLDAQPGEQWIYGYSIDVLGALVEQVSGMPLDQFLRTRIFEPLAMTDTHFYLPEAKRTRLATVYSAKDGGLERAPAPGHMVGQGLYADGPRESFSGGAGLLSTVDDYSRFLQMLLNGGELDGKRILSPKTVELMTTNHIGKIAFRPGEGFGLGFSVVTDVGERGIPGSVGEFGWGGAYHSTYWVDPQEKLVVVYLTQLIPAGGLDDMTKLRALVYQAIVE